MPTRFTTALLTKILATTVPTGKTNEFILYEILFLFTKQTRE